MLCAGTKEKGRSCWVAGIVSLFWIAQKCFGFVIQFWEDVEDRLAAVGQTTNVRGSDDGLDYQTVDEFVNLCKEQRVTSHHQCQ